MATTDTLLLSVDKDFAVKIGKPPENLEDSFYSRSATLGTVTNASHVVCSPNGELFCIRDGDLYRGPLPSNKDVDWFLVARRVGKNEWNKAQHIFFHPNGNFYVSTLNGDLYRGPPPDNESVTWLYNRAKKIGSKIWNNFYKLFFDPIGILYGVYNDDKFYKGPPPTNENFAWRSFNTVIGEGSWGRLTHFMAFSPDGKLWCIDKLDGNIYRGDPPATKDAGYTQNAEHLGRGYNEFKFFAFAKDKIIKNILSFEFLPDEGKKVSEVPEVLEKKLYDNRKSTSTMRHNFPYVTYYRLML